MCSPRVAYYVTSSADMDKEDKRPKAKVDEKEDEKSEKGEKSNELIHSKGKFNDSSRETFKCDWKK